MAIIFNAHWVVLTESQHLTLPSSRSAQAVLLAATATAVRPVLVDGVQAGDSRLHRPTHLHHCPTAKIPSPAFYGTVVNNGARELWSNTKLVVRVQREGPGPPVEVGPMGGLHQARAPSAPCPEPHSSVPAAAGSMYDLRVAVVSPAPCARRSATGPREVWRSQVAAAARPVQPRRTHSERAEAFVLKLYESAVPGRSAEAHGPTDAAAPGRY